MNSNHFELKFSTVRSFTSSNFNTVNKTRISIHSESVYRVHRLMLFLARCAARRFGKVLIGVSSVVLESVRNSSGYNFIIGRVVVPVLVLTVADRVCPSFPVCKSSTTAVFQAILGLSS